MLHHLLRVAIACGLTTIFWPSSGSEFETGIATEEIKFDSQGVRLTGRLWLPEGPGPHPAVVFIPGSGRSIRDLQLDADPLPFRLTAWGIAVFAWDKRGVRDSGGVFELIPDSDRQAQLARLTLLAKDAAAAIETLSSREDISAERVGVWAFSQGGWVASLLESVGARPRFMIIVGGPAVSIGEELHYSAIADAAKEASREGRGPIDFDAIYAQLERDRDPEDGFGGFDPYPYLDHCTTPTLFLLGGHDLSVPTRRSVERLTVLGRHHEWIDHTVFLRASHGLAVRDAAGSWYTLEAAFDTAFEYLSNLDVIGRKIRVKLLIVEEEKKR